MSNYLTETNAANTYATKAQVDSLGTVYIVQKGADLSSFGDEDLIVEIDDEE